MSTQLEAGAFHGLTERRRQFGGLTLAETVYPADLVIPRHEHANPFFCLMLEGCSTQSCAGMTWTNRPATLMIFPAGVAHANRWHNSSGRVLHVEFAPSWLQHLSSGSTVLDHPANYESGPPVWLAQRLFQEHRRNDDVSPLAAEGLALELLAECSRGSAELPRVRPPAWLDRVNQLLHDCLAQNLSLEEIAAVAGVSADHLARSFRRCHGCTIGEHVRRLRVEFACRRLAVSETPLAQVALDAGFADQSHLTKVFKRYMGVTPAAFRKLQGTRRSHTTP
jgi:AraC family transcriptional regulator